MPIDPQLLALLACPEDKGPLLYFADEDTLYNPRLRRRYKIADGIPVMLVDEAETVDETEHARLSAKAATNGVSFNFAAAPDGDDTGRAAAGGGAEPAETA